jgi:hypothetical protein
MTVLNGKGAVVTGAASGIGKATAIRSARVGWRPVVVPALLLAVAISAAHGQQPPAQPSDVAETGKKLANPLSEIWALFTEFDLTFSDGNVNSGHAQVGGRMIFQPILPIPFYGTGEKQWRLITRPTIPALFSQPIPTGLDVFDHKVGLGDTQVPLVISPPTKNWILGAGPTWLFPTSTDDAFGRQQWGVGPAVVVGYYTKAVTLGVFPQYFFGIGSSGGPTNVPHASYLNLLYFLFYNLPNAWQIGFDPTITYDHRASPGNKWNVPIGVDVLKTTRIFGITTKFVLGVEYSVVSQDAFGQRAQLKFSMIPVIPSLIRKPLLGGR